LRLAWIVSLVKFPQEWIIRTEAILSWWSYTLSAVGKIPKAPIPTGVMSRHDCRVQRSITAMRKPVPSKNCS
jgi:hypothetical protein